MLFELDHELLFPDPVFSEPDGLLAVGGDLSPDRLLLAYASGIFPWFSPNDPILWWSPNPRLVLFPDRFHCSDSLRRLLKSNRFRVTCDTVFQQVMQCCASISRKDQHGTWITDKMIEAYCRLHRLGFAHSFETWNGDELVGGLYGVSLGKAFFGESMFAAQSNASKVAFAALVEFSKKHDFYFIDAQTETPHLQSLGAKMISREDFSDLLKISNQHASIRGKWDFVDKKITF